MNNALVIGGTRFIGRHLVSDLLEHGYDVTIFNRGNHDNPFDDDPRVQHIQGDRKDDDALRAAKLTVEPDFVFDCVAYHPGDVASAVDIFTDVEAYVYISSGAAYGHEEIPKREGVTALSECTNDQATSDSHESYGPRKAEGDRVVFEAASRGINAMSIRPCIVYGPDDYTERLDYWIDRVENYDRILVPGDGTNIWHRAYVEDVASAMRIIAEEGEAGEAYNVGDQQLVTLQEMVEVIADAADTAVEVVHAGERELAAAGLSPTDFILYREYPHILSTSKLAALGWESTSVDEAMRRSVESYRESARDGAEHDPGRDAEERVLSILDTL